MKSIFQDLISNALFVYKNGKILRALVGITFILTVNYGSSLAAELRRETVEIRSTTGIHVFYVEVAEDSQSRAKGLMYRTDLRANEGMLFVFPYALKQNFWMKDTPTSLDILFVGSDFKIKKIVEHATPYSLDIIHSGEPVQFVLEILAGRSRVLGIQPGDRLIRIPD